MIYLIAGMGFLFIAIGFIVTENNARYLLSGYNTMSETERRAFDIKSYILLFQMFHIYLGLSFIILGLFIFYTFSELAAGIFLATYPILAYIYFTIRTKRYSNAISGKWNSVSVYLLVGTLVFVLGLFTVGLKEDNLQGSSNRIKIEGIYGEVINVDEISSVSAVDELPQITMKTNGFAMGGISKGYFLTSEGQTVKLILNSRQKPFVLITKKSGKKIYFNARGKSATAVIKEINEVR